MHVREFNQITVSELDKYIIIDTHGGAEDILAIAATLRLAAQYERIVLGITCVNGRRTLEQAVHDALIAQQISGTKVPVFKGSKHGILLNSHYPTCHNLPDQSQLLDNLKVPTELSALVQSTYAPIFIADQIKRYSEQICIITLGPLTNLAIAYHRSQEIRSLSSVRINGGSFTGVGNVIDSISSEGNFKYDPEAAHIVITVNYTHTQNYNNIYINPIETTLETSWESFFKELLKDNRSQQNQLLVTILEISLKEKYVLNGPLLTIVPAFQRQTVQKVLNVYSEVITQGQQIVGLLAPNWLRLEVLEGQQKPNTKIYSTFDLPAIHKIIKTALLG